MIDNALETGKELLIMVDDGPITALALQGNPEKLSYLVVKAMQKDKRFENVFDIAVKTFHGVGKQLPGDDFFEFLKGILDFKPLDCDNCFIADKCDVKDEVHCAKEMPDELREVLNNIFSKGKKED